VKVANCRLAEVMAWYCTCNPRSLTFLYGSWSRILLLLTFRLAIVRRHEISTKDRERPELHQLRLWADRKNRTSGRAHKKDERIGANRSTCTWRDSFIMGYAMTSQAKRRPSFWRFTEPTTVLGKGPKPISYRGLD
jgi:hypothetical protein